MNPEHYPSMTDAQIAEWNMLVNEVGQLRLQLGACEAARAEDAQVHRIAADVAARALDEYRVEKEYLCAQCNAAIARNDRDREQLALIARNMPAFLTDWIMTYSCFEDIALTPDAQEMRRNAHELLTLLEPFAD